MRVLVLCSDKGVEMWGLAQALALYYKLRVHFQPDPLHGLAGILGHVIGCDPVVYAAAMGCVMVSKYLRAPFGSFRNWKAVQGSITFFLVNYGLDDPILSTEFYHGIAEDMGMTVEMLTNNLHELRRILTDFTEAACGCRVELRRWFTWTSGKPTVSVCR
jgi:hypothetical protein